MSGLLGLLCKILLVQSGASVLFTWSVGLLTYSWGINLNLEKVQIRTQVRIKPDTWKNIQILPDNSTFQAYSLSQRSCY